MIPICSLLAFASWTLLTLLFGVGIYRWSRILSGRVAIGAWNASDIDSGSDFYRRAMRAHANCLENLPVFGVVVFAGWALGGGGPWMDALALIVIIGRIVHTLIHICFTQTNTVAAFRFTFFFIQALAMLGMAGIDVRHALNAA